MNKKLETYLEELQRDCNKNISSREEDKNCEHYTAIEVLKVVIKIKDILDEQK